MGDGTNEPATVAGRDGRRGTAQTSYMYVNIDDGWLMDGDYDLYVTVEFHSDALAAMSLQYEAVGDEPTIGRRYAPSPDGALCFRVGEWDHFTFHLPNARCANGQNYGNDFRFSLRPSIVVGKITVSTVRPDDYDRRRVPTKEDLAQHRAASVEGFELTVGDNGTSPAAAALYSVLGVTSVEHYAHWQSVCPDERGQWDWSKWDAQVNILRERGLKWVPFLIAGPAYATPDWFRLSERGHAYRCLEHGEDSFVQSLWNPELFAEVDSYLAAFAEHYPADVLESVLLGVTGIYGESIYPAGPESGWTAARTGDYHNHGGFWCADDLAKADFRRFLKDRYATLAALNRSWGTKYADFDEVEPFMPADRPSDRAYLDLRDWYFEAMTEWSEAWVEAAREHFPESEVYLCTGGNGSAALGADFSAQAKQIAKHDAGIRITNEGSDYGHNFAVTRSVASAGKLYGVYYGFEPASGVDPNGVVARIYNATASGCRQLHYYTNNITGEQQATDNFRANIEYLRPRSPRVDVAVLVPSEWLALNQDRLNPFLGGVAQLRDLVDLDFADTNMIADGCLDRARFLIANEGQRFEADTLGVIEKWIRGGAILIATSDVRLETIEGDTSAQQRLFAQPDASALDNAMRRALTGDVGESICVDVGAGWDGPFIGPGWHSRERGMEWPETEGATKRWSGPKAIAYLPAVEGDATLHIEGIVPQAAVGDDPVLVNGVTVGAMDSASGVWDFDVPADALSGTPVAAVELNCNGWRPSDHGQPDDRVLGIAVRSITLTAKGGARAPEGVPPSVIVTTKIDTATALAPCARRIGKGASIFLPVGWSENQPLAMAAIAEAIERADSYLPGARCVMDLDGDMDGVYWTICENSALVLNYTDAEITREFTVRALDLRPAAAKVGETHSTTVPARSIGEVPW